MATEDGRITPLGKRRPSSPLPLQGRTSIHRQVRHGEAGRRAEILSLRAEDDWESSIILRSCCLYESEGGLGQLYVGQEENDVQHDKRELLVQAAGQQGEVSGGEVGTHRRNEEGESEVM